MHSQFRWDTAARPGFIKDFIAFTECLRGNTERYTGIRKGVNELRTAEDVLSGKDSVLTGN